MKSQAYAWSLTVSRPPFLFWLNFDDILYIYMLNLFNKILSTHFIRKMTSRWSGNFPSLPIFIYNLKKANLFEARNIHTTLKVNLFGAYQSPYVVQRSTCILYCIISVPQKVTSLLSSSLPHCSISMLTHPRV